MAHIIAQPCIGTKDTACVAVCPVDCIHPTKDEATFAEAEMLYIDPDTCIDCGLCVDECPVTAIFPQEDLPAEWADFIEKNTGNYNKWFPGPTAFSAKTPADPSSHQKRKTSGDPQGDGDR